MTDISPKPRTRRALQTTGSVFRLQFAVGADVIFEWDMTSAKPGTVNAFGVADPIHAEVAKIVPQRIPGNEVPQGRQDQHGLWFDLT